MYKFLIKHGQLIALALGILVTAFYYINIGGGIEEFNQLQDVKEQAKSEEGNIFIPGLVLTVILLILCFAAWLIFGGIINIINDTKGALKGLAGFVGLVILFVIIANVVDSSATGSLADTIQKFDITDSQSKYIGGGVAFAMLMFGVGILALVVSEIGNLFR